MKKIIYLLFVICYLRDFCCILVFLNNFYLVYNIMKENLFFLDVSVIYILRFENRKFKEVELIVKGESGDWAIIKNFLKSIQ